MEDLKPKVPPRNSLLNKTVVSENGDNGVINSNNKPMLKPKPKLSIPPKPANLPPVVQASILTTLTNQTVTLTKTTTNSILSTIVESPKVTRIVSSSSTINHDPNQSHLITSPPLPKENKLSNVNIFNKLKISASDLSKLR